MDKEHAFSCFQLKYFPQSAGELNQIMATVLSVKPFRSGLESCNEKYGGSVKSFLCDFNKIQTSLVFTHQNAVQCVSHESCHMFE